MWRPTVPDLALVLGAVAAGGTLTAIQSQGAAELLFSSVLLVLLAWVVRSVVRSARAAGDQRRRAARVAALRPAEAALAAVREERRRLTLEIAASLRDALERIRDEAAGAVVGPGLDERLRRIHGATQQATSELRRHLGLLKEPPVERPPAAAVPTTRPPRRDVVWGAVTVALAAVESVVHPRSEQWPDWTPWSTVLTVLVAATVVGRGALLGPAVVASAVGYGLGSLLGAPVVDGFWTVGAMGALLWSVGARGRTALEVGGGALLLAAVAVTRLRDSPDNAVLTVAILGMAALGGLTVRLVRLTAADAERRADSREQELRLVARTAVDAERAGFARELHDVTSHAIGVIALQAGAAEVSWRTDPDGARRILDVIRATTESALADLERLGADRVVSGRAEDLSALVDRIRATGTQVDLTVDRPPPPELRHVVHRVVQECLTNALRHAPGARVVVMIRTDDGGTTVLVEDDGPGRQQHEPRGYGLVGLAERVAFAGGALEVGAGRSGTGFRVVATLPVRTAVAP